MNNLHHITNNEFYLADGKQGKVLCTTIKGMALVLFHANPDRCPHCEECIPEFKALPRKIGNCTFALCNLNSYPVVAKMSAQTILPIDSVPFIILYIGGRPIYKYNGERTMEEMAEFVVSVSQQLQKKQPFTDTKNAKIQTAEIPGYTIGMPYNIECDKDKGVCFLTFDEAFKGNGASMKRTEGNIMGGQQR